MKTHAARRNEAAYPRIHALLLAYGVCGTLEYLCTFSVFSVLSAD